MQLDIDADSVTGLMTRLPLEAATFRSGIVYENGILSVPEEFASAAKAVMAKEGWQDPLPAPTLSPAEKLAAFLAANPDVASMVGL
ncbi:hypothetical protein LJR009_001585 [Bosea sp. LjRoot9]|uniref:hypothetical protein n=1 Tax=Bosea sp. LjRoot9 TaxID=3342341 RepID=UPI003ECEBEC3